MSEQIDIRFSDADRYLRAALSGLSARQRAIANNVANVDTPNFKASEVRFEDTLRDAMRGRAPGGNGSQEALDAAVSRPREIANTVVRSDGNNVDIDRDMVQLAETTVAYNTLTQAIAARIGIMRAVISGR